MDVSRFDLNNAGQQRAIHNLKCGLCRKVVINPHTCPANHLFCKTCILDYLKSENSCPVDKAPLEPDNVTYSLLINDMIAIFTVRCANQRTGSYLKSIRHRSGCRWKGCVSELKTHEINCPYRKELCKDCHQPFLAGYFRAHQLHCPKRIVLCEMCNTSMPDPELEAHYTECPESAVYCPNQCSLKPNDGEALIIRRKDIRDHLRVCPNRTQRCEFAPLGCKFRGTSDELESHADSSWRSHFSLIAKSHTMIMNSLDSLNSKVSKQISDTPLSVKTTKPARSANISSQASVSGRKSRGFHAFDINLDSPDATQPSTSEHVISDLQNQWDSQRLESQDVQLTEETPQSSSSGTGFTVHELNKHSGEVQVKKELI